MAKAKTNIFFCQECGYESTKWMGQCPGCRAWNSFVEEPVVKSSGKSAGKLGSGTAKPVTLDEIETSETERISSGMAELDRVLGGGIVPGSLVLVGGDPGIGKSTILLQVCKNLAGSGVATLYVSGEESLKQIKMRAARIGQFTGNVKFMCETSLAEIEGAITKEKPKVVIIDSIQTMCNEEISSAPGSVSQVRESTSVLMQLAKKQGVMIFIVGHVTKEGSIAGPRVLEHMVDCVLYFEGERHQSYRIVRAVKNRFGSTNEIGVFEMTDKGLNDVPNPSLMLLSGRPVDAPGSAIVCSVEGTRPILAEIQALVSKSSFAMPRRMATGVDFNRVSLIMTVLEKRMGLHLGDHDAYVNVTGGIRLDESATDLAIACAIASSFRNQPLPADMAFFGEVGLTGEIRTVTQAARRIAEIKKMGFKRCMLPFDCLGSIDKCEGIELVSVRSLSDALQYIRHTVV